MPTESHRLRDSDRSVPRHAAHAAGGPAYAAVAPWPLSHGVIDMDSELVYWRGEYRVLVDRPGLRYSDYEPAVKLGLDAYMRSQGRSLREMETELSACYRRVRGASKLDWDEARPMVEAAWHRLEQRDRKRPGRSAHA